MKRALIAIAAATTLSATAFCAQADDVKVYGEWINSIAGPGSNVNGRTRCLLDFGSTVEPLATESGYILLRVSSAGGCQPGTLFMMPVTEFEKQRDRYNEAAEENKKREAVARKLLDSAGFNNVFVRAFNRIRP